MKRILAFFWERQREDLKRLTREEYDRRLVNTAYADRAFERAWSTRNFEIELYWKRATYFWTFIASSFVAYFAMINAEYYRNSDRFQHVEVFFVACLGFLLSLAWLLTNKGSKQWQRHWETHIDLLEDRFTGPLYKTVNPSTTYSVSKINEIVATAITGVWVLLALKYLADQDLLHITGCPNYFAFIAALGTFALSSAMLFGRGRGRFGVRSISMHDRNVHFVGGEQSAMEQSGEESNRKGQTMSGASQSGQHASAWSGKRCYDPARSHPYW